MKFSLTTKLATALLASFVLMPLQTISAPAQAADVSPKPIFGFVTLGKTTVADVHKLLQEKKCFAEYSYVYGVQFDGQCIGLPDDPAVRLILPQDKIDQDTAEAHAKVREPPKEMLNMPITAAQIGFWEYSKKIFDTYLPLLQKEWGEPKQCFPPSLEARWDCDGVSITMRDDKITYTQSQQ